MDYTTDANLTTFHRINKQHKLPDFVKTATFDTDVSELPSSSFADVVRRQFPCHTRPDTFLSYAYFLKNASALDHTARPRIFADLRKWAHHWAIFSECEQLQREHEKQASEDLDRLDDSQFAIVEQRSGEKYRALPLLNEACVKAAADHLHQYCNRYPMPWRQRAADRILQKAAEFKIEPTVKDPYLLKTAGRQLSSNPDIARAMFERTLLVNKEHKGDKEQLAMLKAARALASANGRPLAKKAASIIDKFDEHYGLKQLYPRGLPTPEELVYGSVSVKNAQDLRDQFIRLTNGSTYTKSALVSAGLEPYRVLGDDFVSEVSDGLNTPDIEKIAAIAPTLPRGDADLLDRALRATGVKTAAALQKEANVPDHIADWTSDDWDRIIALAHK